MKPQSWAGVFAVLVTPFQADLTLDIASLEKQVEFALACGVDGLVTPVMASEFYTLSDEERNKILAVVADVNAGQVPLVAGVAGVSHLHAAALSGAAAALGANALIAMPPYTSNKLTLQQLITYYQAIAASGLPLMVQNAPEPIGSPLALEDLIQLVNAVPAIECIKEETHPNPQQVGHVVRAAPKQVKGVIGGLGGLYLLNELARGATGTMPACQFADVHVRILSLLAENDGEQARAVYDALLPALVMERLYNVSFMKAVLVRRGVISSAATRAIGPTLDASDQNELDFIWHRLSPYLTAATPLAKITPAPE